MKKSFLSNAVLLALFACLIGLSGCSGDDGIRVVSTNINGPLGEYFEVVDKNYKATVEEGLGKSVTINIEIKRVKEGGPTEASWSSRPTFILDFMDEDENVIGSDPTDVVFDDDALEALFSLKEGQSSSIRFTLDGDEETLSKIKKIKISSKWDESKEEKESVQEATTDENEESESESESEFGLDNVILPSQLKGKVEVISASKSVGSYGYPKMEVTFKLLKKVSTSSMCSSYGQMWIIGVGQTENGVDVKELLPNYREWRSGDSDGKEFKEFLEGDPGETITLEFTGDNENSSDVSSDLEKVKKFKLKITN